jgi:hypothetical protein
LKGHELPNYFSYHALAVWLGWITFDFPRLFTTPAEETQTMTTKASRHLQHKERMAAKKANRHKRQEEQQEDADYLIDVGATYAATSVKKGNRRGPGSEYTVGWYESAEEFEKARKLDPESYEGATWEKMNADMEMMYEHWPTLVKVPIRVDDYAAWCQDNNLAFGAESRLTYINQLYSGELNYE